MGHLLSNGSPFGLIHATNLLGNRSAKRHGVSKVDFLQCLLERFWILSINVKCRYDNTLMRLSDQIMSYWKTNSYANFWKCEGVMINFISVVIVIGYKFSWWIQWRLTWNIWKKWSQKAGALIRISCLSFHARKCIRCCSFPLSSY